MGLGVSGFRVSPAKFLGSSRETPKREPFLILLVSGKGPY